MFKKITRQERGYLYFILPAFILFTVFITYPVVNSFNLALTNWDGISPDLEYVGLYNFKVMITNERAINALINTLIIGFGFTILVNIVSLALALFVDNVAKGKNFFRSAFYLPVLISGVIAGLTWGIMFNYSFGIINYILNMFGLESVDYLGKMPNALIAIILVLVWRFAGYYMIIYLAGLQGIPKELVESSKIDGASSLQRFRYITFPLLAGSFTINMTLALINGMKAFDVIVAMTDGGPGFSTENISYLVYKVAFAELQQGYGTALALALFVLLLIISIFQVTVLKKREVQL